MLFFYIAMLLESVLLKEKPVKVLEISMYRSSGCRYGRLAAECLHRVWGQGANAFVDRIDLEEALPEGTKPYRKVLPLEALDYPEELDKYDVIIAADFFEHLDADTAGMFAAQLRAKARQKILAVVPQSAPSEDVFPGGGGEPPELKLLEAVPENVRVFFIEGGAK